MIRVAAMMVICWAWLTASAVAEIVVNEIFANEPGGRENVTLEWFELYNNSEVSVSLDGYEVTVSGGDPFALPSGVTLDGYAYFVVCKQLISSSTPGFEGYWGDSSGVWGDTPYEQSLLQPFEADIALINSGGTVSLAKAGSVVSSFTWTSSGLDAHSWERIHPGSVSYGQSTDPAGATPGRRNSLSPAFHDRSIAEVEAEYEDGLSFVTYIVANIGLNQVGACDLIVIDTEYSPGVPDTIDIVSIPPLAPTRSIAITRQYQLNGTYRYPTAYIPVDDRHSNNEYSFIVPGVDFPPIILSELMANPQDGLHSEWLELKNRSSMSYDLSAWAFGDALHTYAVTDDPFLIAPGEYVVLAESASDFRLFYTGYPHPLIEPDKWPPFNNDGDIVLLIDPFLFVADRFEYDHVFDGNYTWSRGEEGGTRDRWGRSVSSVGSPGGYNEVMFEREEGSVVVSIDPDYVSPDGDGVDDYVTVEIDAPAATDYTVRIYDRTGRPVKTFYSDVSSIPGRFQWDGLSDAGRRLPIGIYVLFVEAAGVDVVKKPIVVAR